MTLSHTWSARLARSVIDLNGSHNTKASHVLPLALLFTDCCHRQRQGEQFTSATANHMSCVALKTWLQTGRDLCQRRRPCTALTGPAMHNRVEALQLLKIDIMQGQESVRKAHAHRSADACGSTPIKPSLCGGDLSRSAPSAVCYYVARAPSHQLLRSNSRIPCPPRPFQTSSTLPISSPRPLPISQPAHLSWASAPLAAERQAHNPVQPSSPFCVDGRHPCTTRQPIRKGKLQR